MPSGRSGPARLGEVVRLVQEQRGLAAALADIAAPVIGVDVERADSDRYYRRAALIQVGSAKGCVLVDPLAISDLSALTEFLEGRLAVLHAIENDLEPLDRAAVALSRVADTAVAAAMLGLPTGLADLLSDVAGVALDSDKDRYQRADWAQRPLSDGMRRYAAEDVVHLPSLWGILRTRLDEEGRRTWYAQELDQTLTHARTDTRDWTRTKGAGRLSPRERAILHALWERREQIVREHDIAPNLLLHDRTLVALAEEPASSPGEIVRRNRRPPGPLRDHVEDLFAAQEAGREAAPRPKDPDRRSTPADREAHDAMRRVRNQVARDLGLDPGVLCPNRQLWDIVHAAPDSVEELCVAGGLRPWQCDVLGTDLLAAYRDAATP